MSENGTSQAISLAAILGRKVGMSRVYDASGTIVPVTVVQAGPCVITQVKTQDGKDGYNAVQLGFEDIKERRSTKPLVGHCQKTGQTSPKRFFREVRLPSKPTVAPGATIDVSSFESIKWVDVVGTSKGKGFQGVMKLWNFGGQPGSHGTERKHRSPGGIGGGQGTRGHGRAIKKGKKMASHMGMERVTTRNLALVAVDKQKNLLLIRGTVPGANGGLVFVRQAKTIAHEQAKAG
ncbi:MAG TPA: 50S ribosomal protein L3 [Phycisphaerae bacterium]|nr:50S ribosomal protein L3 [Phycisphaerae bacterium]